MYHVNGKEVLNKIEKSLNNEKLAQNEILILKLIYYEIEDKKEKIKYFKKSCQLTNKLEDENPIDEIKEVQTYFNETLIKDEKIQEEIKNMISKVKTFQDYMDERSWEETQKYIVKNMRKKGCETPEISKLTGIPIEKIKKYLLDA